jgi:RNA polymerase sigma-70 factor, ECF subfamily
VDFQAFNSPYVDRLRSGDAETEQHFVNYFSQLLTLKLRSRLRSPQAIQDVKQETFARLFSLLRRESGVRNEERLGPLLNSICNNVLMEHYRSSRRSEPLMDEDGANLLDNKTDALREVISDETRKMVHGVLEELSARDRTVLRRLFVEERDKDEVCREMGVDREYLRVLLHRAKQSFRKRLEQQGQKDVKGWL